MSEIFRTVLKDERKRRGLTLVQLAKNLGVVHATVQRWEAGTMSPKLQHLYEWAEALGLTAEVLINERMDDKALASEDKARVSLYTRQLRYMSDEQKRTVDTMLKSMVTERIMAEPG